jgi:hypothetical protein
MIVLTVDEDGELVGDNGGDGRFRGDEGGDEVPELELNACFILLWTAVSEVDKE